MRTEAFAVLFAQISHLYLQDQCRHKYVRRIHAVAGQHEKIILFLRLRVVGQDHVSFRFERNIERFQTAGALGGVHGFDAALQA